jgi:hypothetical protein
LLGGEHSIMLYSLCRYDGGEHNALRVLRVVGRVVLRILKRVIR